MPCPGSAHSQDTRDRRPVGDLRHVAALAGTLTAVVAVQPFLIGGLLMKSSDHLSAASSCLRRQRMTSRAQLGRTDLRADVRLKASAGGPHDVHVSPCDIERPVFRMHRCGGRRLDMESTNETRGCTQVLRCDLMAYRAGDTIQNENKRAQLFSKGQIPKHLTRSIR